MTVDIMLERQAPDKNVMYIKTHILGDPKVYSLTDVELECLMFTCKEYYITYIREKVTA